MRKVTTTTFKQVKNKTPKSLQAFARHVTLNGLALKTKLPIAKTLFRKPRIQFLYIHHVFDDEIDKFDILLDELSKYHSFISYSKAVDKILTDNIDKPYISISSDDGFKNNLAAAAVLDKYGAKGCFFINPDFIGISDYLQTRDICRKRLNFLPTEFMDWDDVDQLLKEGHEIGSHTIGHINIAKTNISEVEDNLNQSFEIINKRCGNASHFSFPYGRFSHFNQISFDMVFKAGYLSCASAERGCHISPLRKLNPDELFIRRDYVVCDWNINHILYFILNNSQKSSMKTNLNPYK